MTFLADMIEKRTLRVAQEFGVLSAADRERLVSCARPPRDFAAALSDRLDIAVIAEVKKASPSAGPIALQCDAAKQALHYQDGGAAAVSVLTEPDFFGGSFADLSDVSDAVNIPVLCKDFVIDPVQLFVARGHGADAVLLMVSVLGERVTEYLDLAETLGVQALVEVVNERELEIARSAGSSVVAVNSRDLHSLKVDRRGALRLVEKAVSLGLTVVAASGIGSRDDIESAADAGAHAVLVGEMLMKADFPEDVLANLTGVPRRVFGAV